MTDKPCLSDSSNHSTVSFNSSEKLIILLLTWEFPPNIIGGLARHCHGLAKSLVKENLEVHVVTSKLSNTPCYEEMDGIKVFRISPLHEQEPNFLTWIGGLNLSMINMVKELSEKYRYQLIHAHDWLVGTSGLILKDELNIPLIATIHSTEHGRNHGIYTELQRFIDEKERQLMSGADQLIVCSQYMKDELQREYGADNERMVVIANGIDEETAQIDKTKIYHHIPIFPQKRLIFSIGRLVKEKGFDLIIEAAPELIAKYPDLYFIIAGTGPMEKNYERKINELGLENHVFLVGYVDDTNRNHLVQNCEMAIFPSLYEPFGIVTLESMIFGKPTIVSKTGGLKGIIEHGNTGLFITPGDKFSLIKQVQILLDNRCLSKELGENGRNRVKRLFSWSRIALETKRIYEETMYKNRYLQS